MRVRAFSLLLVIFLFISLTGAGLGQAQAVDPALDAQTQPEADSNNSSVMFIENVGQFDLPAGSGQASGARFLVHGGDRAIWLAQEAIWVTVMEEPSPPHSPDPAMWEEEMLSPHGAGESENPPRTGVNIKLSFPGANPNPRLEPFNRLETSVNYFLGNDPAGWRSEVPVWGGVRYKDLYPGIDLEVSGESGQVVQRLVVRAGADLSAVRLRVEGADDVELFSSIGGGKGLHLTTAVGEFSLPLIAFNDLDTVLSMKKTTRIEKHNSQVFDIAWPFDQIAPGSNQSLSVSAPQDNPGDLLYATFLGGSSYDYGVHITVDASGAAYVTGSTISNNFPTTPGAVDTSLNGSYDGFVVKLNETGSSITYATYLGGSNDDGASRIAIDASGAAFVTGSTYSNNFPTTPGAVDTSHNGSDDAFVVKLNGAGSAVIYATYLGGNSTEGGGGIAVDASGAAYVTGSTASTNFPTTPGAMDTSYNGGSYDVFMTKLNGSG
ncbi:MAG: SBBP repeat-containing protein, partial [Anaerolineales bacterium]|nr:SBBP repeat-containing protein [Anaerolineales bacterium]